ncbi:uncharacterized protein LOC100183742 [Ciona intestinalis]
MEPTSFHQIPRRYEDTKPAIEQAFAHKTILDIGQRISVKSQEKIEYEKRVALDECEVRTWRKAEIYKDKCVDDAVRKVEAKHKKFVNDLVKKHEEKVRKEVSRIEGVTQHIGAQNTLIERQKGEKKLNEVVAKLHSLFEVEKSTAVEVAQEEERSIASQREEDLRREHEISMEEKHSADEEKERNNLEELRLLMEEKMRKAVEDTILEQEEKAKQMAQEITNNFNKRITKINKEMIELKEKQRKTETALNEMEKLKNKYIEKLKETTDAFTSFIERCRPDFYEGQSDFVLPSNVFDV